MRISNLCVNLDDGLITLKKVKFTLEQATKAQSGGRYNSILPLTSALDEVGDQRHASSALARGKNRFPMYRRLGGSRARSGQVWKNSPPPEFDPQNF